MPDHQRTGFSLVELMVVMVIIAILASAVLVGMSMLGKRAKAEKARKLVVELSQGIDQYLHDHRRLGEDADGIDFEGDPWKFLGRRRLEAGEAAYVDLDAKDLGIGDPPRKADVKTGEQIVDAFGMILVFTVADQTEHGRTYTERVDIRCKMGTAGNDQDDLIYRHEVGQAGWEWVDP